ncbi:MAG: hypothetical protein IJW45_05385 [Oscillospiraceae bacterium]|nr:hypothetical protein [Oscillospiraceae bacterium]
MEKLVFDSGIREFEIDGGGVLRFNPGDPNLYGRFLDAIEKVREVERELVDRARELEQVQDSGAAVLGLLRETDRKLKALLEEVFGQGNDFDALLGGVNLLAVAGDGRRVIENLLGALQPVLAQGAQACVERETAQAVAEAKAERARRGALKG